jgi:hypothetical protein
MVRMSDERLKPGDLAIIDGEVARITHFGYGTTGRADWVTLRGGGLAHHSELIALHEFRQFDERLRPEGAAVTEAANLDVAIAYSETAKREDPRIAKRS